MIVEKFIANLPTLSNWGEQVGGRASLDLPQKNHAFKCYSFHFLKNELQIAKTREKKLEVVTTFEIHLLAHTNLYLLVIYVIENFEIVLH